MSPISVLLNLLWIIFGGLWLAAGWMIAADVMAITIIGLPWTRAAFNIGVYTLLPFGQKAVSRAAYGQHDLGTGLLGVLGPIACSRRLVAGARPPDHSGLAGHNHRRHPVRLGACETRRSRAMANRENDCTCLKSG
jgi:hypothetical protein